MTLLIAAQVIVFAASSLTNVLQTAGQAFERQTGVRVLVNVTLLAPETVELAVSESGLATLLAPVKSVPETACKLPPAKLIVPAPSAAPLLRATVPETRLAPPAKVLVPVNVSVPGPNTVIEPLAIVAAIEAAL